MTEILLILALGCVIGIYKAFNDMKAKKHEQKELKEKLGEDYDLFMKMRDDRKNK